MNTDNNAGFDSLSYDGCGINDKDAYRTRIATFTETEYAEKYGNLFAAAPELLEALEIFICAREGYGSNCFTMDEVEAKARAVIDRATKGTP